jgi:hypothetical protein
MNYPFPIIIALTASLLTAFRQKQTPPQQAEQAKQAQQQTFVEQFDWNGNPVHKYQLDQWGYFTVDEPNKRLYLFSTNHDDPFFIYEIKN